MPLRFNKVERDEWCGRMAGKSHTCEACCDGDCSDCSGTCDCSKCHGGKGASVLDALESKTASGQCPQCGGPSTMLGQLGNRVHYRCRNCGADHSSTYDEPERGEYQDFEEDLGHHLLGPHDHTAALGLEQQVAPAVEQDHGWGGIMESPRVEQAAPEATPGFCTNCGTPMPYAGPHGNQYCPNCHQEHDSYGRPIGGPPAAAQQGHPRAGEPLSQQDEPARWGRVADASMPPATTPYQQKETALPYNPGAYEGQIQDMHPAAQYTYQRAVAQGADPQSAYAAAQEKQGEMGKRAQEGQNTEGVQIPVINTSYHGDRGGFVSTATIKRVSHLL